MSGESDSTAEEGERETDESTENQPQEQHQGSPSGGDNDAEVLAAKVGIFAFAVVGLGYFVMNALVEFIGDEDAGVFSGAGDEELFIASVGALEELVILAPLIAVVLAVYYYMDDESEEAPKMAVIASAVGVLAIGFLLLLLAVIFEPDFVEISIGDELPGFIGVILGTIIVAGGTAYMLDEDPLELF